MKELNSVGYCYDEEIVDRGRTIINSKWNEESILLFKILADNNKFKILTILSDIKECCVCDISNILNISVANASHHLRQMNKYGILKQRKEGKMIFYELKFLKIKDLMKLNYEVNEVLMR